MVKKGGGMRTREVVVEIFEAEKGKVLEVFYEGETEPVYYDRLYSFLLGELDVFGEVDLSEVKKGG